MAVKTYYGLTGTTKNALDASSTYVQVSPTFAGTLLAAGFINGEDETYLIINSSGISEIVKVTDINGVVLTIEREQSQTSAVPHPLGATIAFILTSEAVAQNVPTNIVIESANPPLLDVSEADGVFTLNPARPVIEGQNGIEVLGNWPYLTITKTEAEGNCCGDSSGGGSGGAITDVQGEGIAQVYVNDDIAMVSVQAPSFGSDGSVNIDGTWPYYTFSVNGSGGGGSVVSVGAGAGLGLTGAPTTNPSLYILNTGVIPGMYGRVQINSRGQFISVPADFAPISEIAAGTGISVNRVDDTVTVTAQDGSVGVRGALALADDGEDFDPTDDINAISPAYLDMVLSGISKVAVTSVSYTLAEMFADYSNAIGGTAQSLVLAAGQKALIIAEATMLNTTTPATPVNFGIGVLSASAVVGGNKKMTQSQQSLSFLVNGPFNDTLALATTAIPSGSTVISYGLTVMVLP